jgi:hypothetical protein
MKKKLFTPNFEDALPEKIEYNLTNFLEIAYEDFQNLSFIMIIIHIQVI